jgi:uncharacterized protein (TIGR02145 family)
MKKIPIIFIIISIVSIISCRETAVKPDLSNPVDADGNVYNIVTIGSQVWMVENLRTTKFRNGDPIPNITNDTLWGKLSGGAYCNYNNDLSNVETYGRLYNWYAVNDSRKIAPEGWHIASSQEWWTLINYCGGRDSAGSKLKEVGTKHWSSFNTTATNESGFTGLPGGLRTTTIYRDIGTNGYWWCSDEYPYYPNSANCGWLVFRNDIAQVSYCGKSYGFSVRCIKDN